jgi:membrane protein implicated in regulation of membrane protease activity
MGTRRQALWAFHAAGSSAIAAVRRGRTVDLEGSKGMRNRSPSVLRRYLALQVPGWLIVILVLIAINHWLGVPAWVAVGVFALWVIKDFALYPFLKEAYRSDAPTGAERLVGERGVAVQAFAEDGYVKVRGELWRARSEAGREIPEGSRVLVKGANGLTLIVAPES